MSPRILRGLLAILVVLAVCGSASATITLYDQNETTFDVAGSFNTFYVHSRSDNKIADPDTKRNQSRIKMGFLPNYIAFNFSKQVDKLKLGGRSSFWVTINDRDTNVTSTGIDVRQFYGTVESDWGMILFGKDFTLFNRSNIFRDLILQGYGNVSDTLGLIDGAGVSFGNIGSGYIYPFPSAQITYRTPELAGFKLAIGIIDPSRTTTGGEEEMPRFEGELTYNFEFEQGIVTAWTGFLYQQSENATTSVDSTGFSAGVSATIAGFTAHASGYDAKGVGLLLGPGIDPALGFPVAEAGKEVDSKGYLLQAGYTLNKLMFVASYGKSELESTTPWENETATGAIFYSVNDYLKLVGEYNVNKITKASDEEETNTIALGLILNF